MHHFAVNNWIAALGMRMFKCWNRTVPGVCLPERPVSPFLSFFSPSYRPSHLPSSLIRLIKDILCSPPAIALQQQIKQSARTHTHRLLWGDGGLLEMARQGQAELQRVQRADVKCAPTQTHRFTDNKMEILGQVHTVQYIHMLTHVKHTGMHTTVNKLSNVKYSANKRK